mmetsp:Transcript_106135/g.257814  ORF Transcript_106135/g.257814 Transcript_106135/m.257814 type:complete len:557 (-) Transcript_106135:227-1897(-)
MAQEAESGEVWRADSNSTVHTLSAVVYVQGECERFGRRSVLAWDEELAAVRQLENATLSEAAPVAAVVPRLQLPAGCRDDVARYLSGLSSDKRKQSDVRDMRHAALSDPSAAAKLEVAKHPDCGVVQFGVSFRFWHGARISDWHSKADPLPVTEALGHILEGLGLARACVSVTSKLDLGGNEFFEGWELVWLVAVRTETSLQAHELKLKIEATDLCGSLRAAVPIRALLRNEQDPISYASAEDAGLPRFLASVFTFQVKDDVRVLGGRIVDVIDPSRASVDPSSQFSADSEPPGWIPAQVEMARAPRADDDAGCESVELRFASEVSGIPWMGPRTLTSSLYERLGQVLAGMQCLFAKIGRPIDSAAKVLVKAQMYVLRTGDEILGQLHREGVEADMIESVGLYYPAVDEALTGGDLEITVVMRGGCGSKFPVSKTIPIRAGTAVAFDNVAAYHCMTSLRCASPEGGQRMVLGFFVLRQGAPAPSSEAVAVNYADKVRAMVRLVEKGTLQRFPTSAHANIVEFLAGGSEYVRRRFESSRSFRSKPVTHEGLRVCMCD